MAKALCVSTKEGASPRVGGEEGVNWRSRLQVPVSLRSLHCVSASLRGNAFGKDSPLSIEGGLVGENHTGRIRE